jgi:hypothetical protein
VLLGSTIASTAGASLAVAAPIAAAAEAATPPRTLVKNAPAEQQDYAAREAEAKSLETFKGGDTTIVIGGSVLVIVLVVVLILVIL